LKHAHNTNSSINLTHNTTTTTTTNMSTEAVVSIDLDNALKRIASGKVRDVFEVDDKTILFVASDRISAYDVIMKNVRPPIPPLNPSLKPSRASPKKAPS
jgi:hypothetical protein